MGVRNRSDNMGLRKALLNNKKKNLNRKFIFYSFLVILTYGIGTIFLWGSFRIWDKMAVDPYFLDASNHEAIRWVGQAVFLSTGAIIFSFICWFHLGPNFLLQAIRNLSRSSVQLPSFDIVVWTAPAKTDRERLLK